MELGLESNVRHAIQRQMQLIQLCDQECDASLSRTDASIEQAILLLQNRRVELATAIRSCYSQAKSFHSDLHSRAAAILNQLHSQHTQSHSPSDTTVDAGAKLLKVLDDARAAPLCVGCGGSGVSVDLSNVTNAISELQVDISQASHPMPVMAEVASVSPNAVEVAWKFVPDMSSLGGRGICVIQVTECPSPVQGTSFEATKPVVSSSAQLPYSFCAVANENPFWVDGLSPSTRYSVRVGGMPTPLRTSVSECTSLVCDTRRVIVDSSSVWAWSSAVQFLTPSNSDNVIRRISDGAVMSGSQIVLCDEAAALTDRGGRCDKVAVGFIFSGSAPEQEENLMKRLQSSGWQQPEFFGVLAGRTGVIGGLLPSAKLQPHSPHFIKAQCSAKDMGSNVDGAVDSSHVVALSCSVTDGFLSLAAWVHSTCVMY